MSFISFVVIPLLRGVIMLRIRAIMALPMVMISQRRMMSLSLERSAITQLSLIPSVIIMRAIVSIIEVSTITHAPSVVAAMSTPVTMSVYYNLIRHVVIEQPDSPIRIKLRNEE